MVHRCKKNFSKKVTERKCVLKYRKILCLTIFALPFHYKYSSPYNTNYA